MAASETLVKTRSCLKNEWAIIIKHRDNESFTSRWKLSIGLTSSNLISVLVSDAVRTHTNCACQ